MTPSRAQRSRIFHKERISLPAKRGCEESKLSAPSLHLRVFCFLFRSSPFLSPVLILIFFGNIGELPTDQRMRGKPGWLKFRAKTSPKKIDLRKMSIISAFTNLKNESMLAMSSEKEEGPIAEESQVGSLLYRLALSCWCFDPRPRLLPFGLKRRCCCCRLSALCRQGVPDGADVQASR